MADTYVYTPDLWLPLAGVIALAVLSLHSWRRRSVPAALPLAAGSLFGMLWLLGIALGVSAVAPATKIAWHIFQAAWQLPVATAMTCFALEYAYPGRWLTRRNLMLLALPPLLVLLLMVCSNTQFMWRRLEIAPDGSVARDLAMPGAMLVVYGLSLVLVNITAFLWLFIRSPQHRWPAALMLSGDLASRGMYALYLLNVAPARSLSLLDSFVVAQLLGWSLYAIALFGFRIFDPLPAAHATAVAQMPEGMVVFDAQWRVASLNPRPRVCCRFRQHTSAASCWQRSCRNTATRWRVAQIRMSCPRKLASGPAPASTSTTSTSACFRTFAGWPSGTC